MVPVIPEFDDNECADVETDRVLRTLGAFIGAAAIAFVIVVGLMMWGCAPIKSPTPDASDAGFFTIDLGAWDAGSGGR